MEDEAPLLTVVEEVKNWPPGGVEDVLEAVPEVDEEERDAGIDDEAVREVVDAVLEMLPELVDRVVDTLPEVVEEPAGGPVVEDLTVVEADEVTN